MGDYCGSVWFFDGFWDCATDFWLDSWDCFSAHQYVKAGKCGIMEEIKEVK